MANDDNGQISNSKKTIDTNYMIISSYDIQYINTNKRKEKILMT